MVMGQHVRDPQPPLRPQPTQSVQCGVVVDQGVSNLGGRGRSGGGSVGGRAAERAWATAEGMVQ